MDPIKLMQQAITAAANAHAPYSRYWVGAALHCSDGTIAVGCNVENASYGLTCCAERVAVFSAVAQGKRDFDALVVVASGGDLPYPCGACRQVLAEFCPPDFPIYIAFAHRLDEFEPTTLGELLPHAFHLKPHG